MLKFRDWRNPGVLPGENEAEVPAALAVVDELMRGGSPPKLRQFLVYSNSVHSWLIYMGYTVN